VDVVTADYLETYARMMAPALQEIAIMFESMPPDPVVWIA
jgi:hypothetical protein